MGNLHCNNFWDDQGETLMNKILISIIFILSIALAFFFGVGWGTTQVITKFVDLGQEVLDIQLNPTARAMLITQPELMSYAIKNYKNVTNPFIMTNQRLHYEECIIKGGSEAGCYNGMLSKYGNNTK
jgi:hypothetical protein